MNKTVNINLANTFFHIDEEAYNKLRRYLEAIKRSFSGTAGSDEIIADIEARISELFGEKMEHERQVITMKEVDEVINVMGQPEDYMVDEDIFEDAPRSKSSTTTQSRVKKLYRDTEQKYIGGVCSGLEYYLGLDALWIRIIFILFAIFSGFGIVAYILLWILVPEAASTSQKLDMRGEPINISNIERKVKEGFDDVADRVKSVDYDKVGNKVKSGSKTFFDTLGDIFLFLFKVFGKFIGIILVIVGAANLVALFITMVTLGAFDASNFPVVNFFNLMMDTGVFPIWATLIFGFFAFGIPFFFVLYAGLKILVSNLKSIGNIAKFTLFGLWLISVGVLAAIAIRQAAEHSFTGTTSVNDSLTMEGDTIKITMNNTDEFDFENTMHFGDMRLVHDENGEPLLYSRDVRFDIRKSEDSLLRIKIKKDADGSSFEEARNRSAKIDYGYVLNSDEVVLNDYLTTSKENKLRDQEVRSIVYIPEGKTVVFDESVKQSIGRSTKNDQDYYRRKIVDYQWVMGSDGELKCLNCPDDPESWEDEDEEENRVIINGEGIDINIEDGAESLKVKIDEDGVEIKADEN
ncbi:PspC domain-containing protein [Croceivirga thetidis]|uniref:PspC domain-containing protein n=1 Tax=Croceivirga thetidis TaxID=2721623 RepID=A0ABX1GUQ5_9FLAO|nr:PspC domain-containing protein [Croceivirga thetidis]NKI32786.1 PspC domain-containing protein [Croceivirga thetidis]